MKLPNSELKKLLACIGEDPRVVVPPAPGYDSGVHKIGDKLLVVSTDPCTGVPAEWFGWFLIHYACSDVALYGARPQFCTINLLAPLGTQPQVFEDAMRQTCEAAGELGIAIVTGHTAMYGGVCQLIGVCTAYGTVEPAKLITPANAKAGDLILCTKPIGLETVTNFSLTHREVAAQLFGAQTAAELAKQVRMQSCVQEALQLAQITGVHAMHDATEGGLVGALNEIAEASQVGFKIDFAQIPFAVGVAGLREKFGLSDEQTMALSSTGTILVAVNPKARQKAEKALRRNGLEAHFLGEFTKDKRRLLIKKGKETPFPPTATDAYTQIMASKA
jgi:hydrogenase maturation factor